VLTAAQLNVDVRDNSNETAPAKFTAAGQLFVATGANAGAARTPSSARVETSETTTSSTMTDLTTSGPAVTVTTGTAALVFLTARIESNTASDGGAMGYAVSGASTISATDDTSKALRLISAVANIRQRCTAVIRETGLTAGSNTFTAKYERIGAASTATIAMRELLVIPL
jgi:hypothetical protein